MVRFYFFTWTLSHLKEKNQVFQRVGAPEMIGISIRYSEPNDARAHQSTWAENK